MAERHRRDQTLRLEYVFDRLAKSKLEQVYGPVGSRSCALCRRCDAPAGSLP